MDDAAENSSVNLNGSGSNIFAPYWEGFLVHLSALLLPSHLEMCTHRINVKNLGLFMPFSLRVRLHLMDQVQM